MWVGAELAKPNKGCCNENVGLRKLSTNLHVFLGAHLFIASEQKLYCYIRGRIMNWYIGAFKKFTVFSGRAHRPEYWYFVLFNILVNIACNIVDNVLGTFNPEYGFGPVGGFYMLVALMPGLAVTVRRLHDTGRSGWWILIGLVPFVGWLVMLAFMIFGSESGSNKYGTQPG